MSEKREDGGPAFPVPDGEASDRGVRGLSTRDWFAAAALPAVIEKNLRPTPYDGLSGGECWARTAYDIADHMLKARNE